MKPSAPFLLLVLFAASDLNAQKLETQAPDPKRVVRVETARDHLTVIELNEPVSMVAVGNQNAFTVERRENKVFVKPAEEDARTNLFIWTASGRFSSSPPRAPCSTVHSWPVCGSRAALWIFRCPYDQIWGCTPARSTNGLSRGTEPSELIRTILPKPTDRSCAPSR